MAEKEVTVKVVTTTDISELEQLDDKIEELQSTEEVEVDVDVEDSSVDEATEKTTELEDELDNVDNKVASPEIDTTSIDEAKASVEEAASSMDNLTTAAAGIAATAGIEQMAVTADNINNSWNRLSLTFAGTGVSMDALKAKTSELSAATGRSGGVIRDYFNQMGIAGVTNVGLLSSSFEALAGKSYQTGQSIETMESKMQTMVLTGNASSRMLKTLGLSAEDLASAMGVSADQVNEAFKNMTPEERLQAITKAMGDGAQANEMYKNSYEGLKAQADAAMAGLMGAIGQAILPVVVPALQAATQAIKLLTDGFKSLPGPVQAVIGGIGGFVAIGVTAVGTLGVLGNVLKSIKSGLDALRNISALKDIVVAAKTAALALKDLAVQVLTAGYNALKSAAMWVAEKAAVVASTIAEYAAAAAQWALNVAMSANPIGILIIAITALIAILGYLYFNNEQVRAAIDGLGQTFMMVGQIIYDTFMNIIQWVISGLQMLWEYIFTVGGLIPANVEITGNQVIDTIIRVMAFVATLPIQLAMIFANAIAQVLGFGNNFVQRMFTSAQNAVNRFMTQIKSLPGKFQAELNNMLSAVDRWAATLPAKFWQAGVNAVKNFLSALGIASPGTMQRMMIWEVTEMGKRVPVEGKRLVSNIGTLGEDVVNAFDPNLKGISVANNSFINGVTGSGNGVNGGGDINITINGDVDSEDRVKFFVEAIRKELAWDNTTAGRTN